MSTRHKVLFQRISHKLDSIAMNRHPLLRHRPGNVPVRWVYRRCAVSTAARYLYFRIPKNANTTVTQTLAHYDDHLASVGDDPGGMAAKAQFGNLKQSGARTMEELRARFLLFTVVRNPFTRVLSAYRDKVISGRDDNYDFGYITDRFEKALSELTFAEFITFLEDGGLYANPHWVPQVALLPFPLSEFHIVGRVESLEADMERIVSTALPNVTWTGLILQHYGRTNSSKAVRDHYTPSLVERVRRLYGEDFQQLGYSTSLE